MLRSFALPLVLTMTLAAIPIASQTPEVAIAGYFTSRFQAMDGVGPTDGAQISGRNQALRSYLNDDLVTLRRLLASFPNQVGRTHEYVVRARTGFTFTVYEKSTVTWNNVTERNTGVLTSGVGYTHLVTLEPAGAGYVIAKDAFRGVAWDSPDVASVQAKAAPPSGRIRGLASPAFRPLGFTGTYQRYSAGNYATTYVYSYSPYFNNFNPPPDGEGGDCTNFVSQALNVGGGEAQGAQSDAYGWWYNGSTPYPYSGQAWRYSVTHESWLKANGRGYNVGAATSLDVGDVIYYDWNPANGATDHTALVTGWGGGNTPLVTMHNPDLLHVYWDTWMAAYLKPFTPHFLRMNDTFTY